MDALVSDVQLPASVAGVRALGRAGVRVIALGPDRGAAGLWSRYTAIRKVGPDAAARPAEFAASLTEIAGELGPLIAYPGREESIDAMVEYLPEMPAGLALPYPDREAVRLIRDKTVLPELAGTVGLRTPAVVAQANASELRGTSLAFPCVIKPARPVGQLGSAHIVESERRLDEVLRRRKVPGDEPVLVQERAVGTLISLELVLARDGSVAARFQSRARRTWPDAAGSISAAVSVAPDLDLVDRVAAMLRDVGYWGLAQLDLVDDPKGTTLIDANPRFYACMPLAIACGMNMPAVWHAVATGQATGVPAEYPVGVIYRWLKGDLAAAVRGSPRALLRPGHGRAAAGGMWSRDDPVPGVLLGSRVVGRQLGKILAGRNHERAPKAAQSPS